ncbi:hypothetical protein EYS14_06470 [Alteromonadaceae bacterium M269]|nr:hypothetical protein EYS14_06470 [Alteromonadaceae bacterium M269]
MFKVVFLSFFVAVFATDSLAATGENKHLELGYGMWEGISDYGYYLLVLSESGEHKLYNGHLASAFRKGQSHSFSNENISCGMSECTLEIKNNNDPNSSIRMIATPHLEDSLNVLEINVDNNNRAVLTQTYQLDKKTGKSTIREFVEKYKDRAISRVDEEREGLSGLWVGTIRIRERTQLVALDVRHNDKSEFVLFVNGSSITNETYFDESDISVTGNEIVISTSHATFANKLILHQTTCSTLSGHMYSYHKGYPIEPSDFRLHRVK